MITLIKGFVVTSMLHELKVEKLRFIFVNNIPMA